MTEALRVIGEKKVDISEFPIPPAYLSSLINLINDGTISGKIAKEVFGEMLTHPEPPDRVVERKGLVQVSDSEEIERVVAKVLDDNMDQVENFLSGKEKVFGFLVGQTMKATDGRANPRVVNEVLKKKLDALKRS